MQSRERNILIILVSILFILMISFFFGLKTNAQEKDVLKDSIKVEAEFRNEVVDILKTAGMNNPGITMTKKTADGVNVDYEVVIYVPQYKHFTEMDREKLLKDLYAIELNVDNSSISFSLT